MHFQKSYTSYPNFFVQYPHCRQDNFAKETITELVDDLFKKLAHGGVARQHWLKFTFIPSCATCCFPLFKCMSHSCKRSPAALKGNAGHN